MLCLSADKIMPVAGNCQAFWVFSYCLLFDKKTMSYDVFESKCFKYRGKKKTLSRNYAATRYSGHHWGEIWPEINAKNRVSPGKRQLELCFFDPKSGVNETPYLEILMNITRFQPWSYIDFLNRDFERSTERLIAAEVVRNPATQWVPAVDITDEGSQFLLRADIPGIDLADIDVSMDGNVLSVSGVRHAQERSTDAGAQRLERPTGRFLRRFTLPEAADAEHITAKSRNGILEVAIPKLAEIQARRITVEAD